MFPADLLSCVLYLISILIAIVAVVILGRIAALLYVMAQHADCTSDARLDGKFVIITGGNSGIGKETARQLALRGARVMIACRDPLKGAAAADDVFKTTGQRLAVKTLDLADLNSVRQFANDINKEEPKLDILINNAGVTLSWMSPRQLSKQGYELTFATNHLGHFLLTVLLLPLMKKSAPSRILVISSDTYRWTTMNFEDINGTNNYSTIGAYMKSKLANILFVQELSKRLIGTNVTVNAIHPGTIQTNIANTILSEQPWFLRLLAKALAAVMKVLKALKTVEQGAQTPMYCAVSPELEGVTGQYFGNCEIRRLKRHAKDENAARKLWEISEEMAGLTPIGYD